MKHKYKLVRVTYDPVKLGHFPLRDSEVACYTASNLKVGSPAMFTAESKTPELDARVITTSVVMTIKDIDNGKEFTTESGSTYQLLNI